MTNDTVIPGNNIDQKIWAKVLMDFDVNSYNSRIRVFVKIQPLCVELFL